MCFKCFNNNDYIFKSSTGNTSIGSCLKKVNVTAKLKNSESFNKLELYFDKTQLELFELIDTNYLELTDISIENIN